MIKLKKYIFLYLFLNVLNENYGLRLSQKKVSFSKNVSKRKIVEFNLHNYQLKIDFSPDNYLKMCIIYIYWIRSKECYNIINKYKFKNPIYFLIFNIYKSN